MKKRGCRLLRTAPLALSAIMARPLLQLDRPVRVVEERFPRLVLPARELEVQERAALRLLGLADQAHVGLLRGAAALADVAVDAGADDVLPARQAPLAAGDDV